MLCIVIMRNCVEFQLACLNFLLSCWCSIGKLINQTLPVDDHEQSTLRQQEFEQSRALISDGRQDLVPVSKDVQVLI